MNHKGKEYKLVDNKPENNNPNNNCDECHLTGECIIDSYFAIDKDCLEDDNLFKHWEEVK